MSIKVYAIIFGIVFLIVGLLGFYPPMVPNGFLLNTFTVNTVHNVFHIITGILGLLVAFSAYYSRLYFKVFGIIYLFVAVLAFMRYGDFVYMHLNTADNILHLVVGAIAIYLGFGKPKKQEDRVEEL